MVLADNLIFMITPTIANVAEGAVLPLTTIARRNGNILLNNGNSILLGSPGYYKITATITFTAPATGDAEVKLQNNSVDVPGIIAGVSVATADTEVNSLTLSGIVRVFRCAGISTLTLVNSGIAIDTTNISLDVEYLG